MGTPIIGITGLAGSGKDSFADYLVENHGFAKHGWSYALKDMCCDQYGWDRSQIDNLKYKEEKSPGLDFTRRQILQHIGTEGFRGVDPDHWIKKGMKAINACASHEEVFGVVVPDTRFPNEADAIRAAGGYIIRVVCTDRSTGTKSTDHFSERMMANIKADANIEAAFGDLERLYNRGISAMQELGVTLHG